MKKDLVKAVLFDLDGTLLYTLEDICASVNVPLKNRGLKSISVEECRKTVGNGLKNTLKGCFILREYKTSEEDIDLAFFELQEYYRNNPIKYSKPYDKIIDFLRKIDIPFGILSNKDDDIVKKISSSIFGDIDFDLTAGAKNGILKPSPDRILEFCDEIGINPNELLYVGDSEVDYKTAMNAKTQIALVSWGYRDKEELLKFNALSVDTVDQLWRIINGDK